MSRAHGTRARYVLGEGPGKTPGCRCLPCTRANRDDENRRQRMQAYGLWQPYVDAAAAREHLRALSAAGIGWKRAAVLAGVSNGSVSKLIFGGPGKRPPARRIRPETAARILAVPLSPSLLGPAALTDATGTRRRLQALVACGYSKSRLAERLGMLPSNFASVMSRARVQAGTERAVRALYDELWDVPPDESGHRERISVSRARRYARERGWPPPLGWDEPEIDDPAAGPAEGWQRRARKGTPSRELAEDAEFVRQAGGCQTRNEVAMRLGVSRSQLGQACTRAARQQQRQNDITEREAG